MFRIIVLAVFFPFILATPLIRPSFPPPPTGKIVGGIPISIEEAPYQISLQTQGFHICGGSIIAPNFVLTAGHCTYGNQAKYLTIRAGSNLYRSGGVVIQVERIIQHENFDYYTIDFDFSLLELETALVFSDQIQPIALPSQDEPVDDDTLCIISGWGNTQNAQESKEKLRAAYVPSVNQKECEAAYSSFGGITDRMICAGFKKGQVDACQGLLKLSIFSTTSLINNFPGDSGGPMRAENKLVGVVSWGYQCALPNYPGVYSRVASVRDWVQENSGV